MIRILLILLLLIPKIESAAQINSESPNESAVIRTIDGNDIELDLATTRKSNNEHFIVTVIYNHEAFVINQMHEWLLTVMGKAGDHIDLADIAIDGGMPEHNHGLPTAPRVTENLGEGRYRIEGMRFNMAGWWELRFTIQAQGKTDSVVFNLIITP